jgi:hypothetical protein
LLSRLARETGGVCEFIENEARLDEVLQRLAERLGKPVLQDVEVALHSPTGKAQLIPDTLLPSHHRVVYSGGSLLLLARCRHLEEAERLTITCIAARRQNVEPNRPPACSGASCPAPDMGAGHDSGAGDALRGRTERGTRADILSLSLQLGILSRFTAYIAVDRSEVVNAGGEVRRIVQPVDVPSGWEMFGADVGLHCDSSDVSHLVEPSPLWDVAYMWQAPHRSGKARLMHLVDVGITRTPLRKPDLRRRISETLQQMEQLDRSDDHTIQRWLSQLLIQLMELLAVLQRIPTASDIVAKIELLCKDVEDYLRASPDVHQLDMLLKTVPRRADGAVQTPRAWQTHAVVVIPSRLPSPRGGRPLSHHAYERFTAARMVSH